ncbi:MAG: hypothetical protein PF495_12695 [Spirochaetales bacterium]|jgi:hypothetical protein|nr:hypothetical protein [Spirochaetales bacterium]
MAKLGGAALREISSEGTYGYEVGESLNRPLNVAQYWARKFDLGNEVQLILDILKPLAVVERWASDAVGTVICTELYRQGEMPGDIYLADSAYGKTLDSDVIAGYQKWAIPLASKMRDSKTITKIIKPAAISWAKHMAYLVGVREKPNLLGATLLKIGVPICRFLGEKSLEVQYG